MNQFAIVKSGSSAQIIGPFFNLPAACQYMADNGLIGFTVLPMKNPEAGLSTAFAMEQFIKMRLRENPELVNRKIQLIKEVREKFSCGLKEAKDVCDRILPGPLTTRPGSTPNSDSDDPWQ